MKSHRSAISAIAMLMVTGCATLTEDAMTPIALSFSDGSHGSCEFQNKRGQWKSDVPGTVSVRKSDDELKFQCKTDDGRRGVGGIESGINAAKIAAGVFLDFGIIDSITDKHRTYAPSLVIPVTKNDITPKS